MFYTKKIENLKILIDSLLNDEGVGEDREQLIKQMDEIVKKLILSF